MRRLSPRHTGTLVFTAALLLRLAAVAVTTVTAFNPYAKADADRFAASAADTAATLAAGVLPAVPTDPNRVVTLWGLFLSPLWLLPGPSRLYGRLATALLGAVAVFALYRIAMSLHSRRAGVVAAIPMACYPSYVLVHGTVLREGFVLAGLVGATALVVVRDARPFGRPARWALAALLVVMISIVRWENLPLYALTVGIGLLVRYRSRVPHPRAVAAGTGTAAAIAGWLSRSSLRAALDWLMIKRQRRSRGRTVYFDGYIPDTLLEAAAFAPLAAVYFLFTPFPWMVDTAADLVVFAEAVSNLIAFGLGVVAVPRLWHRAPSVTTALVAGFVFGVLLYGLVNANVGTNVRQRQMFLWVVFLFGGVTVAEHTGNDWLPEWWPTR